MKVYPSTLVIANTACTHTGAQERRMLGEMEELKQEMHRLQKMKAKTPTCGKTDDAMVIAIMPFNSVHPSQHSPPARSA